MRRKHYTKRKTKQTTNIYITNTVCQKFKNIIQKASKTQKEYVNYETEVLEPFLKSITKKTHKTHKIHKTRHH